MSSQDVGEKPDRQRQQAHEVGEDLQDEDRNGHGTAHAGGYEALEIAERTLGAYAFGGVGDENDQRQHERDREVGGGRIEREGGDMQAEDADLVLDVGRQRYVANQVGEENEEEESGDEGEPPGSHLLVHVARDDVLAQQIEDHLDGRLHAVGALAHAPRDVDHADAGQRGRDEEIHHGLGDREVDACEVDRHPVFELELVLGFVAGVAAATTGEDANDDDPKDIGAEDAQQLLFGAETRLPRSSPLIVAAFMRCSVFPATVPRA